MALFFTFMCGIFFLFGIILNKKITNSHNVEILSIAISFVVLLNLIFLDILPEINLTWISVIIIILGMLLLKIMDLLVPCHHHDHHEKDDDEKDHHNHLEHISIISILALCLHNILECMALYNVAKDDVNAGLLMCLAISMHNIPLGFQIGNKISHNEKLYISILTLSGFVGGIIAFYITGIPEIIENYILSFTLGMLVYLCFFEMLMEMKNYLKNKWTYYGIIIGVILVLITHLL